MFQFLSYILIFFVYGRHELQLLTFLHQKLFVLLQQFFIGGESTGISSDAFVERSLNCVNIVTERYPNEFTSMDTHYFYSTWLLVHIVLLSKNITLSKAIHLDGFLPDSMFIREF